MNLTNILTGQLRLGKTILLAWLTAALLYVQWGVTISILDVSPTEFLLKAGMLFGYFVSLMVVGRLVAILVGLLVLMLITPIGIRILIGEASHELVPIPDPVAALRHNEVWQAFQQKLVSIIVNLSDVATMFAAFFLYSDRMVNGLAPIGLGIALVLYILGQFDGPTTNSPGSMGAAG